MLGVCFLPGAGAGRIFAIVPMHIDSSDVVARNVGGPHAIVLSHSGRSVQDHAVDLATAHDRVAKALGARYAEAVSSSFFAQVLAGSLESWRCSQSG